ncbi:MAG: histidine triad nucleotide-binding protein, partial [Rhodospirillales bacterium]|nr:histidine triad nucleotide-binding protein [Rhodospirillales bacterium]
MPVSGLPPYDAANIFARILRGEIPAKKVYEDEWALAFHDIAPQAPVHVLVIPKGRYCSFADFSASASDAEIGGFVRAVGKVARDLGLEAPGYRLLANMGEHSGQEVPHVHVHLFAG